MNAYRRHFIRLNMALVGTVLLVTLLLAGVYVARSEYANMRQTMLETLEPFRGKNGSFSYTPDSGAADQPDEGTRPPQNAPEREMTGEAPQPPGQTGAEAAFSRCISGMAVRPVEQAMEREKQFVADVSHDLKTPLAVMQACRHILMENPAQTVADVQPWLDRSDTAMENMKRLIDDMLTLGAMDAAQRLPRQDTVDLSGVVTRAALQMEAMAYDWGVALETDVQEGVAATGDGDALLRVASGLIENALKYEPENGRIRVTLTDRNRKAAVVVQNFGAVIAPEDLPHVFERFYRGDKARTACQGHGLGLAIIRRTAELMNGKIEVTSTPESGTVFTVTLG
ncbi:MAG: HAMP domain-containing histidine kinase [Clostridiales bacterium]|nr:HAMP domain-containing histidine kinase [Clostridiales bacterium]